MCCEDPSSGIRHSAEREAEKAGEGMVVKNVGHQNEQNATNEEKE